MNEGTEVGTAPEATGGIIETYRKKIENTPAEENIMNRYADLQTKALAIDMNEEETLAVQNELGELYRLLSEEAMDESFRVEMREQAHRLVSNLISIKSITKKFHELEAHPRDGQIPWGTRKDLMNLIDDARRNYGLADHVYRAFADRLVDYDMNSGAAEIIYGAKEK